jgi:hypothetical protein
MNERVLRISFLPLMAALVATFVFSALMAVTTGYVYREEIRIGTYPSLAKALGPVLGAAILGLIVVTHGLRLREERIEQDLLRWLDMKGEWMPSQWDEDVERALEEGVETGSYGPEGFEVEQALEEKRRAGRMRLHATRLFAIPIIALTIITGISLWAVPASGAFLQYNAVLNTTLIFLTTYGTPMAMGALVAAVIITMRE